MVKWLIWNLSYRLMNRNMKRKLFTQHFLGNLNAQHKQIWAARQKVQTVKFSHNLFIFHIFIFFFFFCILTQKTLSVFSLVSTVQVQRVYMIMQSNTKHISHWIWNDPRHTTTAKPHANIVNNKTDSFIICCCCLQGIWHAIKFNHENKKKKKKIENWGRKD